MTTFNSADVERTAESLKKVRKPRRGGTTLWNDQRYPYAFFNRSYRSLAARMDGQKRSVLQGNKLNEKGLKLYNANLRLLYQWARLGGDRNPKELVWMLDLNNPEPAQLNPYFKWIWKDEKLVKIRVSHRKAN